jgi:hypothetical protein
LITLVSSTVLELLLFHAYSHLSTVTKMQTTYSCSLDGDEVVVRGQHPFDFPNDFVKISFERTLRCPNATGVLGHPRPDLGRLPVYKVADYKLPAGLADKGGFLVPVHGQRSRSPWEPWLTYPDCEATWIKFTAAERFAIKVYVHGSNAVTG